MLSREQFEAVGAFVRDALDAIQSQLVVEGQVER